MLEKRKRKTKSKPRTYLLLQFSEFFRNAGRESGIEKKESRGGERKKRVGEREKRESSEGYIIRVMYELGMPITIVMYVYTEG